MRTLRLFFQTCFQGKGYMKTYWLKGKKDLSFKTPAELRYSSEQKDSEDKSSNGWVDNRRAVGTTESLFLGSDWTLDAPPRWFRRSCAHCPLQFQTAGEPRGCLSDLVCLKASCWPQKQRFHWDGSVQVLGYWGTAEKQDRVRQNRKHSRSTGSVWSFGTYF